MVGAVTTGSLRCSLWARTQDLDPAGTAGSYSGYLLLDVPLPWPRDVSEMPEVAALTDLLDGSGLRVQATIPSGAGRRAALYPLPANGRWAGSFSGREAEVRDSVTSTVEGLLSGDGTPIAGRDLLICGHGRRDVCCGSAGTALAMDLAQASLPPGVRLHRTSHTGGHRFAPTFIVLPEATLWAFADVDLAARVLERRGDAADAADRYRGCSALRGPRVQALEREVLREVGWELLGWERTGHSIDTETVRLDAVDPGGRPRSWQAAVTPGRTLPVPDCGRPITEARKTETEWVVEGFREVRPG